MVAVALRSWIVALAGVAALAVPAVASAVQAQSAAEEMPSLVEDYSYPGAEAIQQAREIELIKGDGRLMLVDCTGDPGQLVVESIGRLKYCFALSGASGWLSLRLDQVFLIGAGEQSVQATVTAKGVQETVSVPEGGTRPVGTSDPNFGVLLELRATA
jgi:hypothetical protein